MSSEDTTQVAPVDQLNNALVYGTEGPGLESLLAHYFDMNKLLVTQGGGNGQVRLLTGVPKTRFSSQISAQILYLLLN